jgi:putative ABC transport system ATP-binding protein
MIVCENLVKIYSLAGVELMALQGLDLSVQAGQMLGIVGASGSGKTTLMNVLGGLDRPTAGKVTVFERDLLKLSESELDIYRRTQVGFIWQQTTRNLIPYLTALENVELPLRLAHHSVAEGRPRALELLEILGLSDRLSHRPEQLSGGEQQRVAIAVALANQPPLLLADEPTGELDGATQIDIFNALRKVNTLYHTTVLIVSHDPNIGSFVDRVVRIRDGKTSSETVQSQLQSLTQLENQPAAPQQPARFDELVILDGAGRMQIPREFLEGLSIGDRVRLELEGERIVIRPVDGHRRVAIDPAAAFPSPMDLYVDVEDVAPRALKIPFLERLRRLSIRLGKNLKKKNTGGRL